MGYQATGTTFSLMLRSDGTWTASQLNTPGGYSTQVVPGGQNWGPQHVVPGGLPSGAQQPAATHTDAAVQAIGPQQNTLGGCPGAQNGGVIWTAGLKGSVPGQHCWNGAGAQEVAPQHCGNVGGAQVPWPNGVSGQQKFGGGQLAAVHWAPAVFWFRATTPTVPSAPPTASLNAWRRDRLLPNSRVMASNRSPPATGRDASFSRSETQRFRGAAVGEGMW